uniref:Uncharacterized protein n=1 Tax=Arundo donax TaxID=35708 RepID=A0A0A9TDC6_ARUDO
MVTFFYRCIILHTLFQCVFSQASRGIYFLCVLYP